MIQASRRSFIASAVALVAAPAIVRAASLMQVAPTETLVMPRNMYLTIDEITREAVKLFNQNNKFLQHDYDFYNGEQWGEAEVGKILRIRLPNDYTIGGEGPRLVYDKQLRTIKEIVPLYRPVEPIAPLALAVAAVAVAPDLLEKPVTRRFWSK